MSAASIVPISSASIPRTSGPQNAKLTQAKIDAIVDFAAKVKNWPLVEDAVDEKIKDQAEFVSWRDQKVRRPGNQPIITDTDIIGLSVEAMTEMTGITPMQVSRWRKGLKDIQKYREKMIIAAYRKAELVPAENHRAEGTGENQWFTPEQYIVAARLVMGSIDLDPATHVAAQQIVQATEFYTQQDDGLTKEWHGTVWLNPPYSQPLIGQFVDKLIEEYAAGRADQAILLTHNYTDTSWFHTAEKQASLICFTRGRIKFVDIDGEECAPTQGQAFFYFGSATEEFHAIFGKFGFVR